MKLMSDLMTGAYGRVEVITLVQRRRRWTVEKVWIVEKTYLPESPVSLAVCCVAQLARFSDRTIDVGGKMAISVAVLMYKFRIF